MVWKPHVTVAAIIERENRFLMVEELAGGGQQFNQPAGHLDENEELVAAVIRETLEETAWHFQPSALVGIYQWRHPGNGKTFLRLSFCGSVSGYEEERKLDSGILRSLWLTRAEIEGYSDRLRSPMVLRSIDDYLGGIRYPLSLLTSEI